MVACGPPGLTGGSNTLYRNNGNGTFSDVSEKSGITKANGTYGLGVLTADFDNDGWTDIYVANDSAPSALYRNNKNGTFTDIGIEAGCALSIDGKPQAGMGVTAGITTVMGGWISSRQTSLTILLRSIETPASRRSMTLPFQQEWDSIRAGLAGVVVSSM